MITFLFQSVGSPQVPCRFNAKKFKVHSRADAFIVAIFSLNFLISFRLFEEIVGLWCPLMLLSRWCGYFSGYSTLPAFHIIIPTLDSDRTLENLSTDTNVISLMIIRSTSLNNYWKKRITKVLSKYSELSYPNSPLLSWILITNIFIFFPFSCRTRIITNKWLSSIAKLCWKYKSVKMMVWS